MRNMRKMIQNNWDVISQHLETRYGDAYDYDLDSWTEVHLANSQNYACLNEDIVWVNIKCFPDLDKDNHHRIGLHDKNNSLHLIVKTRPFRLVHKSKTYKSHFLLFRNFMRKFESMPLNICFKEIKN